MEFNEELVALALKQFKMPCLVFDQEGWTTLHSLSIACNLSIGELRIIDKSEYEIRDFYGTEKMRARRRTKPVPASMLVDL